MKKNKKFQFFCKKKKKMCTSSTMPLLSFQPQKELLLNLLVFQLPPKTIQTSISQASFLFIFLYKKRL
jgi:hypothetical protein